MAKLPPELMFSSPIPGESLTQSPDNPRPFERPPEFTNIEKAQEWLFNTLVSEDRVEELIEFIGDGVPIDVLATQIVFAGFANGKWTPDLMLLLLEPTIYILLFISEQAGLDYTFTDEEEYMDNDTVRKVKGSVMKKVKETKESNQEDMQTAIDEKLGGLLSRPMGVGK